MLFRRRLNAATSRSGARSVLPYQKLCEIEDFEHPALSRIVADVFAGYRTPDRPHFPVGFEERKQWEIAMSIRALTELGATGPDGEILGVGAGNEVTSFWLTNLTRRVFATDLYLDPGEWERTAKPSMLLDPQTPFSMAWNKRRLVVQHMNALDLHYEDNTFSGVFSSSSIEHFGELKQVRRSIEEMVRVLRPNGVLTLSTEFRLAGPPPGLPGTLLFDKSDLKTLFAGLPLRESGRRRLRISGRTRQVVVEMSEAAEDVRNRRPLWRTYPHILLHHERHTWTSVHLAFTKTAPTLG